MPNNRESFEGKHPAGDVSRSFGPTTPDGSPPPLRRIVSLNKGERGGSVSAMGIDNGSIDVPVTPQWWRQPSAQKENDIQANPVVDFALKHVESVDDLHAETVEDGAKKLESITSSALRNISLGEPVGVGGIFDVHTIPGEPDLVVKRLKAQQEYVTVAEADEGFEKLRAQHQKFVEAFGADHVPATQFAKIEDTDFGDAHRIALNGGENAFFAGREYVMVQEKLRGLQYQGVTEDTEATLRDAVQGSSETMRDQVRSFIERYRQSPVHPDTNQVVFDFTDEKVSIVDTNAPSSTTYYTHLNSYLQKLDIDPASIVSQQQLADVVIANVPEFAHLQGRPWVEIRDILRPRSSLPAKAEAAINKKYKHEGPGSEGYGDDMNFLLSGLEDFPPEGDNRYVRTLIDIFRL